MTRIVIIVVAIILSVLRVAGVFGVFDSLHPIWVQVFKDTAHLFVGGVIGAAVVCRVHRIGPHALLVRTAIVLSVLETVCAVLQRVVLK